MNHPLPIVIRLMDSRDPSFANRDPRTYLMGNRDQSHGQSSSIVIMRNLNDLNTKKQPNVQTQTDLHKKAQS